MMYSDADTDADAGDHLADCCSSQRSLNILTRCQALERRLLHRRSP
jgi:hypothetical protein